MALPTRRPLLKEPARQLSGGSEVSSSRGANPPQVTLHDAALCAEKSHSQPMRFVNRWYGHHVLRRLPRRFNARTKQNFLRVLD
eukprot:4682171-Amphidinium_carterae.3